MAVRITKAVPQAYDSATCAYHSFAEGDVLTGDIGAWVARMLPDVCEEIPDPEPVILEADVVPDAGDSVTDPGDSPDDEPGSDEADDTDPAGEDAEEVPVDAEPAGFDPEQHTIAEVLAFVDANPGLRGSVRDAEAAGKARTTLLAHLA